MLVVGCLVEERKEMATFKQIHEMLDDLLAEGDEDVCWNWCGMNGEVTRNWYGYVWIEGVLFRVNRIALEYKLGRPLKPGQRWSHFLTQPAKVGSPI
jgi:hypothetical protein